MLNNEKNILQEKLNRTISRLEILNSKKDREKDKIAELESLQSSYSKYCEAKKNLKTAWIIYPIAGVVMEILMHYVYDIFFISELTKWQVIYAIIPVACLLMSVCSSVNRLYSYIQNKKNANIDEEEVASEKELSQNTLKEIVKQINFLKDQQATYSEDLKNIDNLPNMLSRIKRDASTLDCEVDAYPTIEEVLLDEFSNFINEKVDYSKVQLMPDIDIKEYKLKK